MLPPGGPRLSLDVAPLSPRSLVFMYSSSATLYCPPGMLWLALLAPTRRPFICPCIADGAFLSGFTNTLALVFCLFILPSFSLLLVRDWSASLWRHFFSKLEKVLQTAIACFEGFVSVRSLPTADDGACHGTAFL